MRVEHRRAPAAINSQRKARAELVAQRQREADVLTGLKTEQAAAAAKAHAVEVEAAPFTYVARAVLRSARHSADGGSFGAEVRPATK
jgi:hypothetical protein